MFRVLSKEETDNLLLTYANSPNTNIMPYDEWLVQQGYFFKVDDFYFDDFNRAMECIRELGALDGKNHGFQITEVFK